MLLFRPIILAVILAVPLSSTFAQNWRTIGVPNNSVYGMYYDPVDDLLYIGGHFSTFDGQIVNAVASWDGQTFSDLNGGTDLDTTTTNCVDFGCAMRVQDFQRFGEYVYMGVRLRQLGELTINGIARWDGMQWDSVGSGLLKFNGNHGGVGGFSVWQDNLYVVGAFQMIGQDTAHSVARWDGEAWHEVGFPIDQVSPFSINLPADALVFNNELYVSGNFYLEEYIEGLEIHDILKFDGENWLPVANASFRGVVSSIRKMIEYKGELYAAGLIYASEGNPGNGIIKLENDQWVDVGGSFDHQNYQVHDMFVYNDKLYVAGIFNSVGGGIPALNIASWDGEAWNGLDVNAFDNRIFALDAYQGALIVGGGFNNIDGEPFPRIAQWNCSDYNESCEPLVLSTTEAEFEADIQVYPNPVEGYLEFFFDSIQSADVRIYNALG